MGHELQRRTPATVTRADPSWPAVVGTTARLWFDRHYRRRAGRRPLVMVLSVLVAMALGAGVTLAFTQRETGSTRPGTHAPNAIQVAQADRQQAAGWIAREVASNIVVACDLEMCNQLQKSGFPGARLLPLQPTSPDPLGAQLVVATAVIRNQFGTRLASVYAPLVIASFGSGAERVDVRFVAPDGSKTFQAEMATDRKNRIAAGEQLLANNHVEVSADARNALLAGRVDPRLLVTLGALAGLMPIHLVAFDDPSPGASSDVPLRGAEIGAAAAAGLSAMVTFLKAQQDQYAPAVASITQIANGQHVVTVRYDAPGPMGLGGS
ncbi:MAG: hypothetical protein ACRDOD_08900 [Streptosporangiaceae bacterium]